MRRRRILRRLGACAALGATGCLSSAPDAPPADTDSLDGTLTTTDSPIPRQVNGTPDDGSPTPASGIPRRVALASLDDTALRSAFDVAASAAVVEPRVTADHTARVEVALENQGDIDRTLTYVARECGLNALFGSGAGSEARVVLAPADREWASASESCWRVRDRNVSCGIPAMPTEVDLPAGERVAWRFALWATGNGRCMPPDRYRFQRAFDDGAATPADGAPSLSLTLALSDPDS